MAGHPNAPQRPSDVRGRRSMDVPLSQLELRSPLHVPAHLRRPVGHDRPHHPHRGAPLRRDVEVSTSAWSRDEHFALDLGLGHHTLNMYLHYLVGCSFAVDKVMIKESYYYYYYYYSKVWTPSRLRSVSGPQFWPRL